MLYDQYRIGHKTGKQPSPVWIAQKQTLLSTMLLPLL